MAAEKVVLVGVGLKADGAAEMQSSLAELRRLAETAGAEVVAEASQALPRYNPGTLIGTGKVVEVGDLAQAKKAKTVIFDKELSPAQQKSLEQGCRAKIVDRTRLILDIFAQRARTNEGRLQVELAQLSYMLPRLTGAWRGFSQQVGGIGTRGPGERKLEYERRHIQSRMLHLKRDLARVKAGRERQRERRESIPIPQIAIVGYTNVGKSTLLNRLTKSAAVYADDKLFATLDPTARRVKLPDGSWAVAVDTVGFIQRLPTTLVAAFRATLEETKLADCLMLVSDATLDAESRARQDAAVDEVLKELEAEKVPAVRVLNKADRLDRHAKAELARAFPDRLLVSAATGEGIDAALALVQERLAERWMLRELDVPAWAGKIKSAIYACSQVLSEKHTAHKVRYRVRVTSENWHRLQHIAAPTSGRAPGRPPAA